MKKFLQKKLSGGGSKKTMTKVGSPLEVTQSNPMSTTVMPGSPRDAVFTARSGTFNNGNMTLRQSARKPADPLAGEFAVLRADLALPGDE